MRTNRNEIKFYYLFNINYLSLGSMFYSKERLVHLYTEVNIATLRRWIHDRHVASYTIPAYAWQHIKPELINKCTDKSTSRIYHECESKIYDKR